MNQIAESESCLENPQETAKKKARLDLYLGVFSALGTLLILGELYELLLVYTKSNPTAPVAYPFIAIPTSLVAALGSFYFARQQHVGLSLSEDSSPGEVTLTQKKVGLIVAFTAYIVGLTTLAAWTGGAKASPYAPLVLLTASLSPYVAQKNWTRAFVGVLAILSYALVSCWFFDRTTKVVVAARPDLIVHELAIVCIVVVISGYAGYKERTKRT